MNKMLCITLFSVLIFGCSSVVNPPKEFITPEINSYSDTNNADSGIIAAYKNEGFLVTDDVVEEYNKLISIYGSNLDTKISKNDGIKTLNIKFMDNRHFSYYLLLLDFKRLNIEKK